jgi:hypothetical protein
MYRLNNKIIAIFLNLIFVSSIFTSCSNNDNNFNNIKEDKFSTSQFARIDNPTPEDIANLIIDRHFKISNIIDTYEDDSYEMNFINEYSNLEPNNITNEKTSEFCKLIGYKNELEYLNEEREIKENFDIFVSINNYTIEQGQAIVQNAIYESARFPSGGSGGPNDCYDDFQDDVYLCGAAAAIGGGIVALSSGGLLGTLGIAGAYVAYRQCVKSAKADYRDCLNDAIG